MQSHYDLDSAAFPSLLEENSTTPHYLTPSSLFSADLEASHTGSGAIDQSSATSGNESAADYRACLKDSSSESIDLSGELYKNHFDLDQHHDTPGLDCFNQDLSVFGPDDTFYSFLNHDHPLNSTDDDFWDVQAWREASKRQKLYPDMQDDNQTYPAQPEIFDWQNLSQVALDVIQPLDSTYYERMMDEPVVNHNISQSTAQPDTVVEANQLALPAQAIQATESANTHLTMTVPNKRKRKAQSSRVDIGKKEIVPHRFCYLLASDPNAPTLPEYRSTEAQLEDRRVIHSQGGQCVRCRLKKQKCSGTNPCEQCLAFWNKNLNSRTIIWNECIRSKLSDVSPFKVIANQDETWKEVVETPHFYDIFQGQKATAWSNAYQWPPPKKCPFSGSAIADNGQTPRDIAMQGHCTFVAQDDGRDLYFAILALLVVYNGCEHSFHDVIHTAGSRTMRALDHLMDPRRYSMRQHKENCGILVCLFYGLIVFQRLIDRCNKAVNSQFVWQEYKNVGIDTARLKAAFRILGHFFVMMCEQLNVAGEEWYGKPGHHAGTHGFEYVMGICKLVSTFEVEEDLKKVKELLKSLPITSGYNP